MATPRKRPTASSTGTGGFLVALLAALLWKLGVFGGAGGIFPTPGGAESRPSPAADRPAPDSRGVDVASATRRTPRFAVEVRVVARGDGAPQPGRAVALLDAADGGVVDVATADARGTARITGGVDREEAFAAGRLVVREAGDASRADATSERVDPATAVAREGLPTATVTLEVEPAPETRLAGSDAAAGGAADGGGEGGAASRTEPAPPLAPGPARVTGRVLRRDGRPAADLPIDVRVYRRRGGRAADGATTARTDATGRFVVEAVAGRDVLVELRTEAAPSDDAAPFIARAAVLDAENPVDFGEIRASRRTTLVSGRVVDAEGRPLADAVVALRPTRPDADPVGARADAEGRFVVRGPEEIESFALFAETEDLAGRSAGTLLRGAADVALTAGAAGGVEGRIAPPDPSVVPLVDLALETDDGVRFATARPRRDGAFRFPHVAAGRCRLVVFAAGAVDTTLDGVVVAAGAAATDPRLGALRVAAAYVSRRVTVTDAEGAPLAGVLVAARLADYPTPASVRTDAAGVAQVFAPVGVKAVLAASLDGFAPRSIESDGTTDVRLALRRP